MAGIPRKTALIFAGTAAPNDAISEFGSLKGGAAAYSSDPALIQTPAWLLGLAAGLIGNKSPTWQDLNGIFLVLSQQIAYLLSRGIPDYDAGTTYNQWDLCKVAGVVYQWTSATPTINVAPPGGSWVNFLSQQSGSSPALAKAWVLFSGTNVGGGGSCQVLNGFNVSGVQRTAAGSYIVSFATPLPSANYGFAGSAGTPNGQSPAPGDNNFIMGGPAGATIVHTQAACSVFCREPTQTPGLEDSSLIFVNFFGS